MVFAIVVFTTAILYYYFGSAIFVIVNPQDGVVVVVIVNGVVVAITIFVLLLLLLSSLSFFAYISFCLCDVVVGYTMDTMYFSWLDNPVDVDKHLEMPQFTLVEELKYDCSQNYTAGQLLFIIKYKVHMHLQPFAPGFARA